MSKASKNSKGSQKSVSARVPISPTDDNVVVKPMTADELGTKTASGIIIPDSAQEKPEQGYVVAVGPGKFEDGMRTPVSVSVGDKVLFSKYGYDEVKIGGVEYYILSASNIKAVIND